jgi:protein phosphatase
VTPSGDSRALALPEPCLVVLIGAAGSGKSTLAARLFSKDQILSSDAYRAIVSGDESDQRGSKTAYAILHRELDRRMAAHTTTVIDATNVTSYARRALTRRAERHGIPVIAIVLDLDPEIVHARNSARSGRVVPPKAVGQQLASLARAFRREELEQEGFTRLIYIREQADLDRLTLPHDGSPMTPR